MKIGDTVVFIAPSAQFEFVSPANYRKFGPNTRSSAPIQSKPLWYSIFPGTRFEVVGPDNDSDNDLGYMVDLLWRSPRGDVVAVNCYSNMFRALSPLEMLAEQAE